MRPDVSSSGSGRGRRGRSPETSSSATPHASQRSSPGAPRRRSSPSEKNPPQADGSCSSSHSSARTRRSGPHRPAASSPARSGHAFAPPRWRRRPRRGRSAGARVDERDGAGSPPPGRRARGFGARHPQAAGERRASARSSPRATPARARALPGRSPPPAAPTGRPRSRGAARGPRRPGRVPRDRRGGRRTRARSGPGRATPRTGRAPSRRARGTLRVPRPGARCPAGRARARAAGTPPFPGRPGTTGPPSRTERGIPCPRTDPRPSPAGGSSRGLRGRGAVDGAATSGSSVPPARPPPHGLVGWHAWLESSSRRAARSKCARSGRSTTAALSQVRWTDAPSPAPGPARRARPAAAT
jgi:hypothetical protein